MGKCTYINPRQNNIKHKKLRTQIRSLTRKIPRGNERPKLRTTETLTGPQRRDLKMLKKLEASINDQMQINLISKEDLKTQLWFDSDI
jgi:hypothetical protein